MSRNLSVIYEYLLEQRLVWIKENNSSFVESEGNGVTVESRNIKSVNTILRRNHDNEVEDI